jgi:hypothetical protein
MKYLIVSTSLALLVSLAACKPITSSDFSKLGQTFVSYEVEFNPNANDPTNSGALKIESSNQNCPPASQSPGCVRFEKGTFGTISFRLQGQGGNSTKSCSDSGVSWVITGIAGSVTPMPGDPTKGSGWGASLPGWVTTAFYPVADASGGVLYSGPIAESKTAVTLLNLNNNSFDDGVKTLYYQVTASKCDGSGTKTSDPGVENEGLK